MYFGPIGHGGHYVLTLVTLELVLALEHVFQKQVISMAASMDADLQDNKHKTAMGMFHQVIHMSYNIYIQLLQHMKKPSVPRRRKFHLILKMELS